MFVSCLTLARAADDKPIRALLVIGGCCHNYEAQKDILTQGISARANVQWTVAYDADTSTKHKNPLYESAGWYKDFDVIVHDECSADVKDVEFVNRILDAHRHGLPGVNLHCAMHCYRTEPFPGTTPWMEFTGMNTNHHGRQLPIAIAFTDPSNPITKGMQNWTTIQEELYHPEALLPTAHALATGHQDVRREADAVVVWTNDYHGTKVFSTTLGHNTKTVDDPRYLDLITRGMLWSLDKLDDKHLKNAAAGHARVDPQKPGQAPASAVASAAQPPAKEGGCE